MLLEKSKDDEKKELSSKRRELEKAHKRIDELNNLFGHTRITYPESFQMSDMSFFILPMRMREKNSMREYLFLKRKYPKE